MDIAMLHLFGSVPELVMDRYNEIKPLASGWKTRMDIFQLYYLLVHLNMFGRSYLSQVESIIEKYK
jgi:fructosamine-3-kinase